MGLEWSAVKAIRLMIWIHPMVSRIRRPLKLLLQQTRRSLLHQSTNFQDVCLLLVSHAAVGV